MCPNWHDLIQEFGRVDRLLDSKLGEHGYFVYLNVGTFLSLWIRAHAQENTSVCERHTTSLFKVLRMLVLPTKCYHEAIEEHFENPTTYISCGPCTNACSYCTGEYKSISGQVSKAHLIGALQANIFARGVVRADKFVAFITDKANMYSIKRSVWGEKADVPSGKIYKLIDVIRSRNS